MPQDRPNASAYKHPLEAVQRPDVGVEAQFPNKRIAKTYRYDSSLAPELTWDEGPERPFAEWLLTLIVEAAEKGEDVVFASAQIWEGTQERFSSLAQCAARLRSLSKPFLNWAGKAERQQISVPTLPLFVHERHSTQAILETLRAHKASGVTLDMFGDIDLDIADKLDAYEHKGPWTNRLVLGDSLQIMNSLLEYEGMGGQVQMVYFDPPYGVKFGSNFQPFVRKNSVKHGPDDEMIREPEMVKAYRDTWELGLHSYLAYLRDRLLLARELLTESGSIFLQISDDNLHHVREVMDDVFGASNSCGLIAFRTTGGQSSSLLSSSTDFLLWYAKSRDHARFENPTTPKVGGAGGSGQYVLTEPADFSSEPRRMTPEELDGSAPLPEGWRILSHDTLYSQGSPSDPVDEVFNWRGRDFRCPSNTHWKPGVKSGGMSRLAHARRLMLVGNTLRYKRYVDDFPVYQIDNIWNDTARSGFARKKEYVVETSEKVVQRCMLMTTEPGDLVLDVTCGSGTTASVAEQWGRRWITCDTSRVPIALARQRLLTATFPWYHLKTPKAGPAGGFVYQRKKNRKGEEVGGLIPRVTLSSIANSEEPKLVTLSDRPEVSKDITRVCGPFTVEATIQASMSMEEESGPGQQRAQDPRAYLDRMMEVLRQSKTLQLPGNTRLELETVRPLADRDYLHGEAISRNGSEKRIAIVFGPEDGAIGSEYVFNASMEAMQQGFQQLFLFGFAIQAKAHEMLGKLKISTTYVAMTPDIVMSDLLKTSRSSEIFSITGLPDVDVSPAGAVRIDGEQLYHVSIKGLDIFRPDTMETSSIEAENLPCWMLDTNYNGMAFCASQVFFPKTSAWDNLQKSLKGQFEPDVWEHLAGTVSEPFIVGDKQRIAVKVIDERGNELMVVKSVKGGD